MSGQQSAVSHQPGEFAGCRVLIAEGWGEPRALNGGLRPVRTRARKPAAPAVRFYGNLAMRS